VLYGLDRGSDPRKTRRQRKLSSANSSDGRREFGAVAAAIMSVLAETDSEMRLKTIHTEVERVLGGSTSSYSVADYLQRRSKGASPLFARTRPGHYRLRR
jgi:hypothetical protein